MKFNIGDKVIIKSKYGLKKNLKLSTVYKTLKLLNQPYAYIVDIRISEYQKIYILDTQNNIEKTGDYYEERDVTSYIKQERKEKILKINQTR